MIDLNALKEIVRLMVEHDLSEIDLRDGEETVTLKRGVGGAAMMASPAPAMHHAPAPIGACAPAPAAPGADTAGPAIESPMVGTFYAASDPDSPPFVAVGKTVAANDVVCIIEAMKVFNEIKAEKAGRVTRICVENGQPVEFGQKLFMLAPA